MRVVGGGSLERQRLCHCQWLAIRDEKSLLLLGDFVSSPLGAGDTSRSYPLLQALTGLKRVFHLLAAFKDPSIKAFPIVQRKIFNSVDGYVQTSDHCSATDI